MKLGATIPNVELGPDPEPIKALAVAAEELGYDYLMLYDHVVGADMSVRPDWKPFNGQPPVYTIDDPFHEPMVTYGYLAAVTSRIELATGVIILPQRQTVLVAKQVAEVDLLSKGRMRLGVAIGWNPLEYEALGMNFGDRGARMTEQIEVMRKLWTEKSVYFEGKWHKLDHVGIKHMPIQQPIPVWIGGTADAVLKRVAKVGDGWYVPSYMQEEEIREHIGRLHGHAGDLGRDPAEIGIEGIIRMWGGRSAEECAESLSMWKKLGATHVTFNTESEAYKARLGVSHVGTALTDGVRSIDERIDALRRFKEASAASLG
jgi:probable F420-dependent oxidoreductase